MIDLNGKCWVPILASNKQGDYLLVMTPSGLCLPIWKDDGLAYQFEKQLTGIAYLELRDASELLINLIDETFCCVLCVDTTIDDFEYRWKCMISIVKERLEIVNFFNIRDARATWPYVTDRLRKELGDNAEAAQHNDNMENHLSESWILCKFLKYKELKNYAIKKARLATTAAALTEARPQMPWDGSMVCADCGYNWKSRRLTPPSRCASCNSKRIHAV